MTDPANAPAPQRSTLKTAETGRGLVDLNGLRIFSAWFSASAMPLPVQASAG